MNFGEILEPCSRAFWDGFDENEEPSDTQAKPKWIWLTKDGKESYPKELSSFIVIEGTGISNFLTSTTIKEAPAQCRLEKGSVTVYYVPEQKRGIVISEENDLNLSGATTDLLVPWISVADTVFTVSIQPRALYKGKWDDVGSITLIRGIGKSTLQDIKELEAPNFVTGVSAGVASWRYNKNLDISSYVVYMDSPELDAISTIPILKLLHKIGLKCDEKYMAKLKDQSHLYM